MKKKITTHDIANLSIYVALIVILSFVPYLGYIDIGTISITTIPVFVSIATWHLGWKGAITTSLTFGLAGYMKALISPSIYTFFVNYPEINILPRFFMGLLIGLVIQLLKDIKVWKVVLTSALAVIGNTFFFTVWYFIMKEYRSAEDLGTLKAFLVVIYINFLVEVAVGIFLGMATYKLTYYLKNTHSNKKAISY